MTITETPKSETEERNENETPSSGRSRLESNSSHLSPRDAVKKKVTGRRRKLSSASGEDDPVEEVIKGMESPDELEALENLSEEEEDRSDNEQPRLPKQSDKNLADAFKLRRADMKHYRRILKKSEVWEKKTNPDSKFRARSASHSLPRSSHPHLLLRAFHDDSRLAFSKMHSFSDPNIARSGASSSEGTIGESSKESSTASLDDHYQQSQENLAETIGDAFRKLEAKYRKASVSSDRSDSEDTTTGVGPDDSSEGTESLTLGVSQEKSLKVVEVPISETPHRVFSLARKFSVMAKDHQQPSSYKSVRQMKARERRQGCQDAGNPNSTAEAKPKSRRPSKSDPYAERDGTRTVITVSENKDGSKCVITNREGSQRLSQSDMWRHRFGDMKFDPTSELSTHKAKEMFVVVSDDEEEDDASVFVRSGIRRSVKDSIKSIEDNRQDEAKGPQGATAYRAPSIRDRLRSMQEQATVNTQLQALSKMQVSNTIVKSLQERLKELEQCKKEKLTEKQQQQHPRMKAMSMSSDGTAGGSSFTEDTSDSQPSSRRSSNCSSSGSAAKRSASFTVYEFKNFNNESAGSSSRSSFSTEEDSSMPSQFKTLRQRFEELERAISKPVPKCVDPAKDLRKVGRTSGSGSDSSSSKSPGS